MKMKKMVGALALSAALAMGTAPAFATVADDGSTNAFSDNGSTEIKAKVDKVDTAIRATVPLQVTVVFGSHEGSDILGPSASSYKITNIGTGDIKLTEAEITDMSSVFTSTPMHISGEHKYQTSTVDTDNGGFIYTTPATGDHINFAFDAGTVKTYLTTGHKASQASATGTDKRVRDDATAWPTEGIAIAKGGDLPITLGGVAYFNSTLDSGELTDTLCKIKYTIAAA